MKFLEARNRRRPQGLDLALTLRFVGEALRAGYSQKALESIAAGRLRHVRAGGDGGSNMPEGTILRDGKIVVQQSEEK